MKECKYCEMMFPVIELNHKMTLKQIIEIDKHLMHRGKGLSRNDPFFYI